MERKGKSDCKPRSLPRGWFVRDSVRTKRVQTTCEIRRTSLPLVAKQTLVNQAYAAYAGLGASLDFRRYLVDFVRPNLRAAAQ